MYVGVEMSGINGPVLNGSASLDMEFSQIQIAQQTQQPEVDAEQRSLMVSTGTLGPVVTASLTVPTVVSDDFTPYNPAGILQVGAIYQAPSPVRTTSM